MHLGRQVAALITRCTSGGVALDVFHHIFSAGCLLKMCVVGAGPATNVSVFSKSPERSVAELSFDCGQPGFFWILESYCAFLCPGTCSCLICLVNTCFVQREQGESDSCFSTTTWTVLHVRCSSMSGGTLFGNLAEQTMTWYYSISPAWQQPWDRDYASPGHTEAHLEGLAVKPILYSCSLFHD
jgi:hypothetical protein